MTNILRNNAPVNVADLQAIVLDHLDQIALEIRTSNKDFFRLFGTAGRSSVDRRGAGHPPHAACQVIPDKEDKSNGDARSAHRSVDLGSGYRDQFAEDLIRMLSYLGQGHANARSAAPQGQRQKHGLRDAPVIGFHGHQTS